MAQHPESAYWLTLAYASGLKLDRVKAIVNAWCLEERQPLSALFELPAAQIGTQAGLSAEEAGQITAAAKRVADQVSWLIQLEGAGIDTLTRADRRYPSPLIRSLSPAMQPLLLFCQGDVAMLSGPSAAVIGSHDAGYETIGFTRELAALLAEEGLYIVGGLSKGVGEAAFDGALSVEGGQTIAVLPLGLGAFQPSQQVADAIEGGQALLVSPFHPKAKFDEKQAWARNKLIVGLAQAVFVVAAHQDDITWQTANEALQLGKAVYVRDADATTEPAAAGNQTLIGAGALPITGVSDILEAGEDAVKRMLDQSEETAPLPAAPLSAPEEKEADEPFDPRAALDLLSKAGRVPDTLAKRLQEDEEPQK